MTERMKQQRARRSGLVRLLVVLLGLVLGGTAFGLWPSSAATDPFPAALAKPVCGPGALKETSIDGRVPASDYDSGRYAKGYRCNTQLVSRQGDTGGFKVERYVDVAGHVCAYYDSTLLFPKDVLMQAAKGLGVVVLDMSNPAKPVKTDQLVSPAMLSPHESLLLNNKRGLLGAELGNPATNVSVPRPVRREDRLPPPPAALEHAHRRTRPRERVGARRPDVLHHRHRREHLPGRRRRRPGQPEGDLHAVRRELPRRAGVSTTAARLYVANIGNSGAGNVASGGLRILDVSQIQDRTPTRRSPVLSSLTWRELSIPQAAEPFTRNGQHYLLEFDEYANYSAAGGATQASSPVGAARIIDIEDPRHPRVVSDIRLAVHQPKARQGAQQQGPRRAQPGAGVRRALLLGADPHGPEPRGVLDDPVRAAPVRHPRRPRTRGRSATSTSRSRSATSRSTPPSEGAYAMSQPAWDRAHDSIWYSDGNSGFFDVRLTNGLQDLL